jgi:hypothetical protein
LVFVAKVCCITLAFRTFTYMSTLSFPIGPFVPQATYTAAQVADAIAYLAVFPTVLEATIQHLDEVHLNTPYRPGGWTVAQVVHHLADSHSHCMLRIKLALSEDKPTIKPYDQAATALLSDYDLPINYSTTQLHCIHKKITHLYKHMSEADMQRTYIHPEYNKEYALLDVLFTYEWHCKHHLADIKLVAG